jgi:hypothetical protein
LFAGQFIFSLSRNSVGNHSVQSVYGSNKALKLNALKSKLVYILFKNSVRTSKRTPNLTITKINLLTLFKKLEQNKLKISMLSLSTCLFSLIFLRNNEWWNRSCRPVKKVADIQYRPGRSKVFLHSGPRIVFPFNSTVKKSILALFLKTNRQFPYI